MIGKCHGTYCFGCSLVSQEHLFVTASVQLMKTAPLFFDSPADLVVLLCVIPKVREDMEESGWIIFAEFVFFFSSVMVNLWKSSLENSSKRPFLRGNRELF